jgi:hypothetical protein
MSLLRRVSSNPRINPMHCDPRPAIRNPLQCEKSTLLQIFGPYLCQEPEVRKMIEDALPQIFQFLEGRPDYAKELHIFRLPDAEPSFPVDFNGNYCPYHLSMMNK